MKRLIGFIGLSMLFFVQASCGDESDPAGPGRIQGVVADPLTATFSGSVAGDVQVSISEDSTTWVNLGSLNGITIQLQTDGDTTNVHGEQSVPAASSTWVRLTFQNAEARLDAGSVFGGTTLANSEMRQAFGFSLEHDVFYGGYPGAAPLVSDPERWRRYILDSLVETIVARDVLLLYPVAKPALLRRSFDLGCRYSGQVLSYNKMLGQLQDVGNTTTLAHYLDLLAAAGLLTGVHKYAGAVASATRAPA